MIVIPVGLVLSAPLSVRVHPGDVVIDLTAAIAVTMGVPVNSCPVGFKPAVTIILPISVGTGRTTERKCHSSGQCAGKNCTTP
jgi:hypothetical protein